MKLLRLKITDPNGFRSLPCGFEHHFRTEWSLQNEQAEANNFAPFVCAGPNGSGKSNLLEALAAIFFQLEVLRVRRSFLPEALQDENLRASPSGFELEYFIKVPVMYTHIGSSPWFKVQIYKRPNKNKITWWVFDSKNQPYDALNTIVIDHLIPQILGYSSGENEILSLPFFKMRFVQFDEYWNALVKQSRYPGYPETRLAYLDNGFSQAILLCNLLFQDEATLLPFREDMGIGELKEFRIILRRSIPVTRHQVAAFTSGDYILPTEVEDGRFVDTGAIYLDPDTGDYRLKLLQGLEGDEHTSIIEKLKRCSTLYFHDEASDTLILDYCVNDHTKQAFRANFDDKPVALFQALQVLLTLNLYPVSEAQKSKLYTSTSHYVSETVPTLASDERAMRIKNFYFTKRGVEKPMLLKELSDGEHQLLHSLGLCLLFRDTNSLFLLDEPETHFNPDWRANFISRLSQCLSGNGEFSQEMLITTHTPFLISDSKPDKVLVFAKEKGTGAVSIEPPGFNTFGASINMITMSKVFGKRETIGANAQASLDALRVRFEQGAEDKEALITEIHEKLGDSLEKVLLIKAILDGDQPNN